jgi:hypothetical protein
MARDCEERVQKSAEEMKREIVDLTATLRQGFNQYGVQSKELSEIRNDPVLLVVYMDESIDRANCLLKQRTLYSERDHPDLIELFETLEKIKDRTDGQLRRFANRMGIPGY